MYEDLVKSLKICGTPALINEKCIAFHDGCCEAEPVCMYELMREAADAIEGLLKAAKAMHTWIFLNSVDEQDAYDECGLTDEMNMALGYGGQYNVEITKDGEP